MGRASHLSLLAEAYARAGRFDEGLGVIEEAIAIMADTGERSNEAELYRLRGDLLRQQAGEKGRKVAIDTRAEQSLEQAMAIARRQGARGFELRAALALYRLRQGRRGHAQARRLLGEVYGGFTEGFDTADLRAARALLDGP